MVHLSLQIFAVVGQNWGNYELPGQMEPVSPALAGGYFTTEPEGKPAAPQFTEGGLNLSEDIFSRHDYRLKATIPSM